MTTIENKTAENTFNGIDGITELSPESMDAISAGYVFFDGDEVQVLNNKGEITRVYTAKSKRAKCDAWLKALDYCRAHGYWTMKLDTKEEVDRVRKKYNVKYI